MSRPSVAAPRNPSTKTPPAKTAIPTIGKPSPDHPDFAALKKAKLRFIIPATIFFLVYYMTLPVLVGFFPEMMKTPVWGKVNWAYLFALSQFIMTWVLCAMYVRVAKAGTT